jgi:hypothetical protein
MVMMGILSMLLMGFVQRHALMDDPTQWNDIYKSQWVRLIIYVLICIDINVHIHNYHLYARQQGVTTMQDLFSSLTTATSLLFVVGHASLLMIDSFLHILMDETFRKCPMKGLRRVLLTLWSCYLSLSS